MKPNRIILIAIIALVAAIIVFFVFFYNRGQGTAGLTPSPITTPADPHTPAPLEEPLDVVISTDLVRELVFQLARTRLNEPVLLIERGENPLLYVPTEEDILIMQEADLVIYNGLGLEPGLEAVLDEVKKTTKVAAITDTLEKNELITSLFYESGYDPHFWWNPDLWEKAIYHTVEIFSQLDPVNEFNYKSTFIRYGQSLSMLNNRYMKNWSGRLPDERRFIVSLHPSFAYFGRKFGFVTRSLYTPSSPDIVSPDQRRAVADFIVEKQIKAIFPEAGYPVTEIEALQAEVARRGYTVAIGEPLFSYFLGEEGQREYLYLDAGRTLMDRIYTALKPPEAPDLPK